MQVGSDAAVDACRDGTLGLTLDPQLIRDLTVLITSSTVTARLVDVANTVSACQLLAQRRLELVGALQHLWSDSGGRTGSGAV